MWLLVCLCAMSIMLLATTSHAKPFLTATCEEPRGPRIDYGAPLLGDQSIRNLEESEDGFSDINPVFIIDDQDTQSLTVLWGNIKPFEDARKAAPPELKNIIPPLEAKQYPIVFFSADQISAVDVTSNGIWAFSLFPKLKYGIYSRVTHRVIGAHILGALYHSRCDFAISRESPK